MDTPRPNKKKNVGLGVTTTGPSLRSKLKIYKKRAAEIEAYLVQKPNEWGKFQDEFNREVENIFKDIMDFEKENVLQGREERVYKLKQIFIKRIRELFLRGEYGLWSFRKPYGYAGDFKIIDDIYRNDPTSTGFERLNDNYFLMSAISIAVRNRKEDFKKIISNFINCRQSGEMRIMNLASGPCRELKELLSNDGSVAKQVIFDCYDHDERSLNFAKSLVGDCAHINFIKENAIRIAFKKNIQQLIGIKYDLIYSTGLLDYFGERVGTALIKNLRKLLKPNGVLAIASVRDKYSNPSVHYMEWAGDWNLVYRTEKEFMKIFTDAGFKESELRHNYEQKKIMQYITTSRSITS